MSKSKGKDSISIKRYKNGGIYIKPSQKDMLARYDIGGMISGLTGLATKANPILGGVLGMGANIVGGLLGGNDQQEQMQKQMERQRMQNNNVQFQQNLQPQQQYTPTFKEGGKIKKGPSIAVADTARMPIINPKNPDLLTGVRDRMSQYKNVNDPSMYKDLQPEQMAQMFNVLKESTNDRTNAYTQRLLDNFNRTNARPGVYYESDTIKSPSKLKSVFEGDPRYKQLQQQYSTPGTLNTTVQSTGYAGNAGQGVKGNNQKYSLGGALHQGTGANINYTTQYPYGGNMQQPNAELEQGEPFRTPNGDISQVSNNAPTHEQGGVPLNLPEGSEILGKMVDPVFGKEFKKLGEQLKKAQDRYQKVLDEKPTPLARKTAKMMLDKVQGQYDQLMQRQESMKSQQDPTQQQFPYGGMPLMQNGRVVQYPYGGQLPKYGKPNESNNYSMTTPLNGKSNYNYNWTNPNGNQTYYPPQPQQFNTVDYNNLPSPVENDNTNYSTGIAPITPGYQQKGNDYTPPPSDNNFGDIASTIGALAPVAYNLGQGLFGNAQQLNPNSFQNPYNSQVKSLMANRRYNVDPELESNKLATAQYYQNLKQGAPSQSRYLAGLQSGQIANQRANQDVYSKANNMNNQYKGEEAQSLSNMGDREAATKMQIQDINSRSQASQRNYIPTALSQLSQFSQVQKQMSGEKKLDKQRLAIAKEMYKNYPFDMNKIIEYNK